jgi:hypothetical protein
VCVCVWVGGGGVPWCQEGWCVVVAAAAGQLLAVVRLCVCEEMGWGDGGRKTVAQWGEGPWSGYVCVCVGGSLVVAGGWVRGPAPVADEDGQGFFLGMWIGRDVCAVHLIVLCAVWCVLQGSQRQADP